MILHLNINFPQTLAALCLMLAILLMIAACTEPEVLSPVTITTVVQESETLRVHVPDEQDSSIISLPTDRITDSKTPNPLLPPTVSQESGAARTHVQVELDTALNPDVKIKFAELGLTLLQPVDRKIWFASVATVDLDTVTSIEGVHEVRLIEPQDKLSPKLLEDPTPFEYQRRERDRVAYSVLFHKGVTSGQVEELADVVQAKLENFDPVAFGIVRAVTLNVPNGGLHSLATADIIARIELPQPPYEDHNIYSQRLSNVDDVHEAPFNLDGEGLTVGVWENGIVSDHSDLTPRVFVQAGQTRFTDSHAMHVAGTVGASGINVPETQGMAPKVAIASWDAENDTNEMSRAASSLGDPGQPRPIQISNHSYGSHIGWSDRLDNFRDIQFIFGRYNNQSVAFDDVVTQTGLIVVRSAGNHRNNVPDDPPPDKPGDCLQGGFGIAADCIGPPAVAKNVITVGAMNGSGEIAAYSSYGPTDDGRIKPDLMAQGSHVRSLDIQYRENSAAATSIKSGTSMATPVVSGIAALVLQEAGRLNISMSPASMKTLLIQTAQDVQGIGEATKGPDYATGWGIVDVEAAVNLLRKGGLFQGVLNSTGAENSISLPFLVPDGLDEIHFTLGWDDPSAVPDGQILVNDLDLRLIAPDGSVFTPWILDYTNPGQAAVWNGGNDSVNNVEQVLVENPQAGIWTALIFAQEGNLPQAPQAFSVSGSLFGPPLWTWGDNGSGRLGNGTTLDSLEPSWVNLDSIQAVAAGRAHTMAISADGSLWGWGDNTYGQLGDRTTEDQHNPIQTGQFGRGVQEGVRFRLNATWESVATGADHTLAIRTDGSLWAWGLNSSGRLGDGTRINREIPTRIGTNSWRSVSAGAMHTAAIKSDNTLWTWGHQSNGRLGHGVDYLNIPRTVDYRPRDIPVQVGLDEWQSVSAGHSHTLGIKTDGTLWGWGSNSRGQLGDGTTDDKDTPVRIGTDTWNLISAGDKFTLAIKSDGTLWSWGYNRYNQLGDGTTIDRHTPTQVGSDVWTGIGAGQLHSIAIKSDGTLWSWGRSQSGELGVGTREYSSRPIQIGSGKWIAISAGYSHTIAVLMH